ncbi:H/ACA ribonucleoprotein complex subunit 1 [Pneumocystis murina B123]|uniref:H/ACA ribonucleoprotein complex subunit n=1 Tax=Pneumocystis murina (strain B123) TaxID=1069680 RepID=M7NXD7_PNEMU|nr:H/ACA ribonucleoprotein complex subunit 1 [Pneumocystis murina B123]EMR11831.1 H/ACA ribonucleoprotein complex subunit 1 [Pneumocystis murina B123]
MNKQYFQSHIQNKNKWRGYSNTSANTNNVEIGSFVHACEGEMLYASTHTKIPYFNAPIYLENNCLIGKIDEILGPINQVYFTVKPQEGIIATSFHTGDKVYIGSDKLLPLERFLSLPKSTILKKKHGMFQTGNQAKGNRSHQKFNKKDRPSISGRKNFASFKKPKTSQRNFKRNR